MNSFLWGGGFQGIVNDFGRPPVLNWTGLSYEEGGAAGRPAKVAVRRRQSIAEGVQLSEVMEEAVHETESLAAIDGAVCAAAAVDTRNWELVHFSLWDHDAPKTPGEAFQVLHMSQPGRDRLQRGRQW
jgi:hypothetical protein